MKSAPSTTALLDRLRRIRNTFDGDAAADKLDILKQLNERTIRQPHAIRRLHDDLCFLCAYPDTPAVRRAAEAGLDHVGAMVREQSDSMRERLEGSGIDGSAIRNVYSYDAAAWLCNHFGEQIDVDWASAETTTKIDALLSHFLLRAEIQAFEDTDMTTEAWVADARGSAAATDLAWMLRQVDHAIGNARSRRDLYEAAEVPLVWRLDGSAGAITRNRLSPARVFHHRNDRRPTIDNARREVARPLQAIRHVPAREGERLILMAIAMLAARGREVYAFCHGNPAEVYVADVGRGVQIVVNGVVPAMRLSLEGNYGYMMLKNGVPVGYGGVSPLFHQANTGINIFEAFRGGSSAFLWVQTLRTFASLFGVTRFVIDPYQFGRDNPEAIDSGAFWFYYRLGFRPRDAAGRKVAAAEWRKLRADRKYRTDKRTLRTLATSDMHLTLPGERADRFFDESWITRSGEGVTRVIAAEGLLDRTAAVQRIARRVAKVLGAGDRRRWPAAEREAFETMAPYAALIDDLPDWPQRDRTALARLFRAKGGRTERPYVKSLESSRRFRKQLALFASRFTKV